MNKWVEDEAAKRLESGEDNDALTALDDRAAYERTVRLRVAAEYIFDNRCGHDRMRPTAFASREFWADLGEALYGADDPRVLELREAADVPEGTAFAKRPR